MGETPKPPARPVTMGETPKPPAQPVTMGETPKPPAQPVTMGETPKPPAQPVTMGETPKPPAQPVTMGETPKPPAQPARVPGNQAAFVVAWAQHRGRLYALCRRWSGGNHDDAEDALSQVALRAVEENRARAAVLNYPGWLTRIAWNQCMDMRRERASRRRTIERFVKDGGIDAAPAEDHPEGALLGGELRRHLQRAIDDLPPRLREPCRRRFLEDAPYERIAAELDATNAAARKRIQEALDILHGRLGAYVRTGEAARRVADARPRTTRKRRRK